MICRSKGPFIIIIITIITIITVAVMAVGVVAVGVPLLVRAPTRAHNHPSFHAIPQNLKVKAQGSGKGQLCSSASIPANVAHRTLKPTRGDEDFSKSAKPQADLPVPKPVESHICPKWDLHLFPTIVPSGLQL